MSSFRRAICGRLLVALVGGSLVTTAVPTGAVDGPRVEEIHFESGPYTLVGVLVLPAGSGPHPAVIVVA